MININTPQTISGKIKTRTPTQAEALSSRYVFLNLNNAEPNLGTPKSPGIKQEYLGDDGYRYLLLSNNTSSLSAWRVWSFDNPRIAAYSKENSIALGDNANPINNNSIVYNNHPYGTNVYNSQSFRDNSFNVFSLSGIYLFDATTIGDPASATAFVVTDDGKVGINTNSPQEALTIVGNVSATGNLIINTNATLGKGKTSTNILRGTVKIADSSPSSVVFGVSDANYDTNLYRGGTNILKTDDLFVCDSLSAMGTISTGGGNSNQWNSSYASISTLNLTVYSNEIHVSQVDGNDITGTGYICNPVATIGKAISLVTAQKRKIIVHSGGYTENPSITGIYTTLTSEQQKGDDVIINGTVSTNIGCTIAGLKMTNLTITAPAGTGNVNVLGCDITGTLTKSNNTTYTLIRFCDIGTVNITGAGLVAMFGGNPNHITINNNTAQVIVKTATTIAPILTDGNANFVDSIVIAAGATSNAITTAAGTIVTLANSQFIVPAYDNVARVSLGGYYSIFNCTYDKPNSTLTGTSTNSIDYFQYINAEKLITTGGNSDSWNSAYTTLKSISSIIPDPATTISVGIGVGTTALNSINFLNTSSAQLLYTVPVGKTFLVTDYSIIIDAVAGGNVSDTSLPTVRLYKSDTLTTAIYQVTNQLALTIPGTLITANRYYRTGGSNTASNGKALVSGDDASPLNKIWLKVDSVGTNTYTGLSGRVIVTGNFI